MRLTNLTRTNEIGANSYLLEIAGKKVVLDAGLHPKHDLPEDTLPDLSPLRSVKSDAIIVSHAHLDHLGSLPVVMRHQPDARVFMSEATASLADPILHNSVSVMHKKAAEKKIAGYPLFTRSEIDLAMRKFQAVHLERPWSLDGHPSVDPSSEVTFTFHEAGHILGSVGVSLHSSEGTVLYTGDVNFRDQTICRAARFPESGIDTLVVETTRGANEAPNWSREGEIEKFATAIESAFQRKGAVLIPVFALGKTQEALAILHALFLTKRLRRCPIHIGALSWRFSKLHDRLVESYPRLVPGLDLLSDVDPSMVDGRSIRGMKPRPGEIYLLSSGMMTEKTLSNIVARRFLSEERHGVVFIGYTDPDSPSGRLKAAVAAQQEVVLDQESGSFPIRCSVNSIDLTAHAQREDILNYICRLNPRHTVLVHGDAPALDWFSGQLAHLKPQMKVTVPSPAVPVEL